MRERESRSGTGRDNLFLWTIFLLVLAGVAFACWLGSFYVFGHPEQPRSYQLLRRLNKLPSPARFLVTKAPPGDFLDAQKIFERYSKFTNLQLERENQIYIRNYIKNYTETKKLVPYLTGKFQVLSVYELRSVDFFPSGVVALTQAVDFPQVLAELVYTTNPENMEDIKALLRPGVEVRLDRTLDLSAVVQVGRAQDGRLHLTVVPLLYGRYALKNGLGSFSLEPPRELNVGAGLPLIRGEEVRAVFREQVEQRKRRVAGNALPEKGLEPDSKEVVRMDQPKPAAGTESVAGVAALSGQSAGLPSGASSSLPSLPGRPEGVPMAPAEPPAPVDARDIPRGANALPEPSAAVARAEEKESEKIKAAKPAPKIQAESSVPPKVVSMRPGAPPAASPVPSGKGSPNAVPATSPNGAVASKPVSGGGVAKPEGVHADRAVVKVSDSPGASSTSGGATGRPPVGAVPSTKEGSPPRVAAVVSQNTAGTGTAQGGGSAPLTNRPVVVASPSMNAAGRPESWRTYGPGKQPQGRSVSLDQAVSLRGRNDGAPVYLRGKFLVTAADRNQAVMRQEASDSGSVPTRVIVEYPSGAVPPARGSSVLRGEGRGFEIREVRRGADGQVNVYVREVVAQ